MNRRFIVVFTCAICILLYFMEPKKQDSWLSDFVPSNEKDKLSPDRYSIISGLNADKSIIFLKYKSFVDFRSTSFRNVRCAHTYLVRGVRFKNRGEPIQIYFSNGLLQVTHILMSPTRPQTERVVILVCAPGEITKSLTSVGTVG